MQNENVINQCSKPTQSNPEDQFAIIEEFISERASTYKPKKNVK